MTDSSPLRFARSLKGQMSELGIPRDEHVLFGSAVMKLHGLKADIGDVDVFVSPLTFARLRKLRSMWVEQRPRDDDPPLLESVGDLPVKFNLFHAWSSRDRWIDVPDAWYRAEWVSGIWAVPLSMVALWKQEALLLSGFRLLKHERDLRVLAAAGIHPLREQR